MILENWDQEAKEVIRNMSNVEKDRLNTIVSMHIMVCNMNDESAYMEWIYLVPDEASEWDFIDFAQDEESFNEAANLFKKLWKDYAEDKGGLFIGNKTY